MKVNAAILSFVYMVCAITKPQHIFFNPLLIFFFMETSKKSTAAQNTAGAETKTGNAQEKATAKKTANTNEPKTPGKAATKTETDARLEAANEQLKRAEETLMLLEAEREEAKEAAERAKDKAEKLFDELRNLKEYKKPLSAVERLAKFEKLQTLINHHERAQSKKKELEQFTELLDNFGGFIELGITDEQQNTEQINFRITDTNTLKTVINLLHETIGDYLGEKLKQIEAYKI